MADEDSRIAEIAAGVVEHFDIRPARTLDELNDALRGHNYLIRQIGAVRPDLYERLAILAQKRRAALIKDLDHG